MTTTLADWISVLSTGIGGLGSAAAAIVATRAISESRKIRIGSTRPLLTFEFSHTLTGFNGDRRQNGVFEYIIRNNGVGPALITPDAFGPEQTYFQQDGRRVRRLVVLTQHGDSTVPNSMPSVMAPNDKILRRFVLGYFEGGIMENPWKFSIKYSDINAREHRTEVSIDPESGIVKHMEFDDGR